MTSASLARRGSGIANVLPGHFSPGGASFLLQPHAGTMVEIHLNETDRIDWALKSFKRSVMKAGILREIRRRRHYVKPSEARQIKSKAAQRLRAKAARGRRD